MSSSTQTEELRDSDVPSPPSPPPPSAYSSTNYAASNPLSNPYPDINEELAPVLQEENAFLSPRTAPKPPPSPPQNFRTSHLPHSFPPRPEPAQTNGPSRKRRHHPRISRADLDRLAQNDEFAPPPLPPFNIEVISTAESRPNCSDDSEPLLERLRSRKRGAVRYAPPRPSCPADFQAKPEDDDVEFRESINFSDDGFEMGEDDDLSQEQQFEGPTRFGNWGDRWMMPPPRRERLHGAFTGGFEAGYFDEDSWKHGDDGALATEPMPQFSDNRYEDDGEGPTTRDIPGMIEAGIAQSREDEFATAWFGDRERHVRSARVIPGGLIEMARLQDRGVEANEESSVGATKYMVDEVHHQNMIRALKGKPSTVAKVEVAGMSATDTGGVERNLEGLDEVQGSAEASKQHRSKKRRVSRIPVAVKSRPTS